MNVVAKAMIGDKLSSVQKQFGGIFDDEEEEASPKTKKGGKKGKKKEDFLSSIGLGDSDEDESGEGGEPQDSDEDEKDSKKKKGKKSSLVSKLSRRVYFACWLCLLWLRMGLTVAFF
eukprot:TRINITY_DN4794_c0_g1_i1.p2 TRINITY_DN4794_c0_g1~~TRINITY_DN4794_c0_g1_i1.p2  ORF type:complete len:117 (+),score=35.19 TRINITY_DN4794_c0_g1_i1:53-403(+)